MTPEAVSAAHPVINVILQEVSNRRTILHPPGVSCGFLPAEDWLRGGPPGNLNRGHIRPGLVPGARLFLQADIPWGGQDDADDIHEAVLRGDADGWGVVEHGQVDINPWISQQQFNHLQVSFLARDEERRRLFSLSRHCIHLRMLQQVLDNWEVPQQAAPEEWGVQVCRIGVVNINIGHAAEVLNLLKGPIPGCFPQLVLQCDHEKKKEKKSKRRSCFPSTLCKLFTLSRLEKTSED